MEKNRDTLDKIKEKIKINFSIQFSGKVKKFLRVFYEWGRDTKGSYAKTTMEKYVENLVEDYEKNTVGEVKVCKTSGTPCKTPIHSDL